jgi:tetratricopeptide (TPR) repeat protein
MLWAVATSALVLMAAAFLWRVFAAPPALRVAVPRPVVEGAETQEETREALAFVAQAALAAALDRLATTPRIAPLSAVELGESAAVDGPGGSSPDRARRDANLLALGRAAAADEVLELSLREASGVGLLTLVRLRADGVVLWTDSFAVPLDPQDILLVRDAVTQRLAQAYPQHRIHPNDRARFLGRSASPVSVQDYLAFLELRRQVENGGDGQDQRRWLEQVTELTESSPGFLQGQIQLADLARSLFTSTGERRYYEQAMAALDRAAELAPEDPRPQIWRARLLLADRRGEAARSILEAAERRAPGHPSIPLLQAEAADLEGHAEEARRILSKAVATFPSWQNLYRLAVLEHRDGLAEDARRHLGEALQRSPGNPWVLRRLASLELSHGELERAEALFSELVSQDPQAVAPRINLGLARFLQGEYEAAAEELEVVLAVHPDHATAWLNLADARLAAGDREAAQTAYQRVLELLDSPNLRPEETLHRAQALAHLGRFREAVELSQRAVEQQPENAEALFMAAVVYSLAGEHHSALVAAERSLDRGMQPVWFRIPAFDSLRAGSDLDRLLAGGT